MCAFPVTVDYTVSGTEIDYFDQSGTLTRIFLHQTEQDTFTANGRTLVGTPFQFNFDARFDSDGNVTQAFTSRLVENDSAFRTELCLSALVGQIGRSA